jgi:hypothetical protein
MPDWRTVITLYLDADTYDGLLKLNGTVVARFLDGNKTLFALHTGDLRACMATMFRIKHPNVALPAKLDPDLEKSDVRWTDAFPRDVYNRKCRTRFGERSSTRLLLDLTKLGYPDGWTAVDGPSGKQVKEWLLKTIEVRVLALTDSRCYSCTLSLFIV